MFNYVTELGLDYSFPSSLLTNAAPLLSARCCVSIFSIILLFVDTYIKVDANSTGLLYPEELRQSTVCRSCKLVHKVALAKNLCFIYYFKTRY